MTQVTPEHIVQLLQQGLSHDNLLDVAKSCEKLASSTSPRRGLFSLLQVVCVSLSRAMDGPIHADDVSQVEADFSSAAVALVKHSNAEAFYRLGEATDQALQIIRSQRRA